MTEAELLADIESYGWTVDSTSTGGTVGDGSWKLMEAHCHKISGNVMTLRRFEYLIPSAQDPDVAYYRDYDHNLSSSYDEMRAWLDGLHAAETIEGYSIVSWDEKNDSAIVMIYEDNNQTVTEQRSFVEKVDGSWTYKEIVAA